jgi:pimeloyl-ACP methyl ester carboxylesterase
MTDDAQIHPFRIEVPQADLDDLRARLARTRWPDQLEGVGWDYGIPLDYVRELAGYWGTAYDWRVHERELNSFPQFTTTIQGQRVHFMHVRSPEPDAVPLIMTHGWPGSVVEFTKVIGPLTDPRAHGGDPADAFHLVLPSIPGYGFSGPTREPGWNVARIAQAWDELMTRLGYHSYGAQGGDWGAGVTAAIGARHPGRVTGIHLNMVIVPPDPATMDDLTEQEQSALAAMKYYRDWDSGYSKEQSTRPQTVGYGLVDSPVGLCAWIVEKFWSWTDCDGDPANVLTRDEMLDDVMLYWLPGAGASSARLYWESFGKPSAGTVNVPVGCSLFPKEIFRASRRWAEKQFPDLRYWNEPPKGGHFAAFEQPDAFVGEVRAAFRTFG